MHDIHGDDDYVISSQECGTSSGDDESSAVSIQENFVDEPKYLVFASYLKQLLKVSPSCGHIVIEANFKHTGSLLSVKLTCLEGHEFIWN